MRALSTVRLGVVATALVLAFLWLASPATAVPFNNVCRNSLLTTNWDWVFGTMTATAPGAVAHDGAVPLTNIRLMMFVPGTIFVDQYNVGLLSAGTNNVPITLHAVIDASNTVQGSQSTNNLNAALSTTISDPDGVPGSGDETAADASLAVFFAAQTWTAGANGTIDFHEHPDTAITGVAGGGIIFVEHFAGGLINVQFHCAPGYVEGSHPGVPTFTEPPPIASTGIIANRAPTANAGSDQTVASGAVVGLDGIASPEPDGEALTYAWTQSSGTPVSMVLADTPTPSVLAPTGPATLTFQLQVCDPSNACDTDSVTVSVSAPNNPDPVGDGIGSDTDNCPTTANQGQADGDGDGRGDACDSHSFGGFLAPVDNPPVVNVGKAGRTYPLTWHVTDAAGNEVTSLSAVSSMKHKAVPCGSFSGDPTDALETTATGGTALRYEGQFIYNWKTPSQPGCYEVFVTLADGGVHTANFNLR